MYAHVPEELTWATVREREEEVRRARPRIEECPRSRLTLRSRLARHLVHAGLHLDHTAGELAADHREPRAAV